MKRSPMPRRQKPLARKSPMRRGTSTLKQTPLAPVNRERKAAELLRCYGTPARRDFVTQRDCDTCGREATPDYPNQQSHIEVWGTSYRADKERVITQCFACHGELGAAGSAAAYEREAGMEPGTLDRMANEVTRLCDARGL